MWLLLMQARGIGTVQNCERLCMFSGTRYLFLLTAAESVSDPSATALMCLIYPE